MDPRKLGLSEEDLAALGYSVGDQGSSAAAGESPGPSIRGVDAPRPSAAAARVAASVRRWFWTTVILLAAGWASSSYRQRPGPVPANTPDTVFSSGRAMSQLVEVVGGPRPVGSPEHARVRSYLVDRLRTLGLETDIQVATTAADDGAAAVSATMNNVVARLPGSESTGALLLTAHYDGFPLAGAAGDDGVGVAAILETVRVLVSGTPLRNDVIVLFADGGELGGSGARVFATEHPWMGAVATAVSVEMQGVSGPAWLLETERENDPLVRAIASSTRRALAHSITGGMAARTGHPESVAPFQARGIPTLRYVGVGGQEAHHQSLDVAERVSERTLAHQGVQLLAVVRALGRADFAAPSNSTTDVRAYLSLSGLGIVSYPVSWSLIATIGLWVLWLALAVLFRALGGNPKRIGVGVGLALITIVVSAGTGFGMTELLRGTHDEFGRLAGAVYNDGIHVGAIVAAVFGLTVLGYGLARRRFRRTELYLGAVLPALVLLAWAAWRMPFAGTALIPPILFALLMAGAIVALLANRRGGTWAWAASLVFAAAILWVGVPPLEWSAATLTPRAGATLAALVAIGTLLLIPVMEWLVAPWPWLTPSVALVAAAGMVTVALPGVQGEERHPELTSLVLLAEDTMTVSGAVVATSTTLPDSVAVAAGAEPSDRTPVPETVDPESPVADTLPLGGEGQVSIAIRRVTGTWLTVPGSGEEWARSWVVAGPPGPRPPEGLLLPAGVDWSAAGTGPAPELGRPTVEVAANTGTGALMVRLTVRSGLGGEMIGLRLADDVAGAVVAVDGRPLSSSVPSAARSIRHWSPRDRTTFDLRLDANVTTLTFDVIEHHLRPQALLGDEFYERDASVIPDASTGTDRVVQRVRVAVPLERESGGG